jgi:hypothetical protein
MKSFRFVSMLTLVVGCFAFFQPVLIQPVYGEEISDLLKDAPPQKLMAVGLGLMDLNEAEKAEFGKVVDEFSVKTGKAIRNIMKRNAPGMPRKIGKKLRRAFSDLDKKMKPIVPMEKWDAYLIFKKGLADQLTPG